MYQPFNDRAEIEAYQIEQLNRLFDEIVGCNEFYTPKLEGVSFDSIEAFQESVPFTTREEWTSDQLNHPPYGTNLTYSMERYTRLCQTSGTTGQPMRWLDTTGSWAWMLGNWARVFEAAGVRPGARVFFPFSFGPFLGFWTAFEAATRCEFMAIPGGGVSSEIRVRMICEHKTDTLCCTPTYAIHLGMIAEKSGIDPETLPVERIIVAGEPGGSIPATRDRIEALWPKAKVWDHHGMTEVGPVTYPHPRDKDVLCIMENSYIAEVIDPVTGEPAEPGHPGELVLTTLGRLGSPLIRYRTGDRVLERAEDDMIVEKQLHGGILGRADDMVIVRGVNLFPGAFERVLRPFDELEEYQVEVDRSGSMDEISLMVEPDPANDTPDLTQRIEAELKRVFGLRIPVKSVAPDTLPRHELKARRWVVTE